MKPSDLSVPLLKDFMSLPASYHAIRADVAYQNFLLRYGTHFIRSAKFGGKLTIRKTAKRDRSMSADEFQKIAQSEFQSMFGTSSSKSTASAWSFSVLGFGMNKPNRQESGKETPRNNANRKSSSSDGTSQKSRSSAFTETTVEAQGGSAEIALALSNFYTPNFNPLFYRWIKSVPSHAKPFDFSLESIHKIFDINMDDLFQSNSQGWNECCDSTGNKTSGKPACRYRDIEEFKQDLERRRLSLEKAIAVYMEEGPFPTSSFELEAGEAGCEFSQVQKKPENLTFKELKANKFAIVFDMPADIEDMIEAKAKFIVQYEVERWFATAPGSERHLYDGCQLIGFNETDTKVCLRGLILTYDDGTGLFRVAADDFWRAKTSMPELPNWLMESTVAKVEKAVDDISQQVRMPCKVKWLNSNKLDPVRKVSCVHFTASSDGDVFVLFAAIPKNRSTWSSLRISTEGVTFYKGFSQVHQVQQVGI
jgi:hypothetical protein